MLSLGLCFKPKIRPGLSNPSLGLSQLCVGSFSAKVKRKRHRTRIFISSIPSLVQKRLHLLEQADAELEEDVETGNGSGHDQEDLPGLHVVVAVRNRGFWWLRFSLPEAEQRCLDKKC